jgi:hypothetical protein
MRSGLIDLTRIRAAAAVMCLALLSTSAYAQSLGTFRWQLQPFCNVITVNVTQQGGIYLVDGTDDRCGNGNQAGSAVGIANLTPLGLIGFGITTVLPGGMPVHTEATISPSSLGGTWRDSAGNSGTFVFNPGPSATATPRPIPPGGIPPASITNVQIANNAVTTANIVDASITSVDILDAPRAQFAGGDQLLPLTVNAAVVRSINITAPTAGTLIVNASGHFFFPDQTTLDVARCSITTGTQIDFSHLIAFAENTTDAMIYIPFGATRGFSVAAGMHTINLVCEEAYGDTAVGDSELTAIFVGGA